MKTDTNQSTEEVKDLITTFILMFGLWRNLKDTGKGCIKVIWEGRHHKNYQTATCYLISINKY